MRDFTKLAVWTKAHNLTLRVYAESASFPREETYGITSQVRRAASSIAANIAEGCGREGEPELARFLRISMGSASEVEYFLLLAKDLNYLAKVDYDSLIEDLFEVKRMQVRFLQRLTRTGQMLRANR
jgi:four helix bundle protein